MLATEPSPAASPDTPSSFWRREASLVAIAVVTLAAATSVGAAGSGERLSPTSVRNSGRADEARLLKALRATHPNTRFTRVVRSPVSGFYAVWMDNNVAYVAAREPRYFFFGRLFDTRSLRDVTADRLMPTAVTGRDGATTSPEDSSAAASGSLPPAVKFDHLPLADAITTVHGDGSRRLAVFSDPACSYCRQLEQELAEITNLTVHAFLVPFQGPDLPVAVWCAQDREAAWHAWMRRGDRSGLAATGATCVHPMDRNLALAQAHGVQGTPTIIWADGSRTEGFISRDAIESRLRQAATGERP